MRVVMIITRACAELGEELERVPPRERAEYLRSLAMQGLYRRREINAGLAGAGVPAIPIQHTTPDPAPDRNLRRLKSKALASLEND